MNTPLIHFLGVVSLLVIAVGSVAHLSIDEHTQTATVFCKPIVSPRVQAEAFYVYDFVGERVLFEKNSEAQLPLASLTKVMTAFAAAQILDDQAVITIDSFTLEPEGDSGFVLGETWTAGLLREFTLISSSNDGARALATASAGTVDAFVTRMNAVAQEIGMSQTYFLNETGLDVSVSTAGGYGSARDIAQLLGFIFIKEPRVLEGSTQLAGVFRSLSGFEHNTSHTSELPGTVPGEITLKTGFTDLAGGNLAALAELMPGRPVAIVVLGSTREARDQDVLTLSEAARESLIRATLCTL